MATANVISVDDSNFETEVVRSTEPVLVDFWAEWCGPCKMIAPIVDEIASEKAGVLKVVKVNVDQAHGLAQRFNIRAIPTLLFLQGGVVKDQVVGMTSKRELLAKADALA